MRGIRMADEGARDGDTQALSGLTPGSKVSHYVIVEKIGAGGMGEVYLAEDALLDRKVALKFPSAAMLSDTEGLARFRREAQSAARLNHPNIVTIYDVCEHRGSPVIAMEYAEGVPLDEFCKGGSPPISTILDTAIQLADGLDAAHRHGIVHRDIKPKNIQIDAQGQCKILDFGLAKLAGGDQVTRNGMLTGTVDYMSPEQIGGGTVDQRSDLFALGIVLFELLAGVRPFRGPNTAAILNAIINSEPDSLSFYRSDLPPSLQAIVAKLLEKKPEFRYQSASDLLVELRMVTGGATVVLKRRHPLSLHSLRSRKRILYLLMLLVLVAVATVIVSRRFPSAAKTKMLAVLPLRNLGPAEKDYFTDGLTEELLSRLFYVSGLGIISRSSTFQYKGSTKSPKLIGSELGADYLVEGAVRWDDASAPSRVRIRVELIRTSDAVVVWENQYDAVLTEIFGIQSDIAGRIATELNPALLASEKRSLASVPTVNSGAIDFSLRGRQYLQTKTKEALFNAQQMFEKAIALDSNFALAHALLGRVHTEIYWYFYDRTERRLASALREIRAALRIDPTLPEAHTAMGYYYYHAKLDYDSSLVQFRLALAQQPGNGDLHAAIGLVERRMGKWQESVAECQRALSQNPRDANLLGEIAATLICMRRYPEADSNLTASLQLSRDQDMTYYYRWFLSLLWKGDTRTARKQLAEAEQVIPFGWGTERYQVFLDIYERQYDQALQRLDRVRPTVGLVPIDLAEFYCSKADIFRYQHRTELMRQQYDSARVTLETALRDNPNEPWYHSLLGRALAGLGDKERAIREGMLAVNLLPVSRDAFDGPDLVGQLAEIYMMVGDYDSAIEQLRSALAIPSFLSPQLIRLWPESEPTAR